MDEEAQAALVDSVYVSNLAVGEKDDRRIHLLLEMYNEAFTLLGEDEVRKCKHDVLKMIKSLEGSDGNESDSNESDGNESDGNESDGSSSGSDDSDGIDTGSDSDEEADDEPEGITKKLGKMEEFYMIGEKYKDPMVLDAVLDRMCIDMAHFVREGEKNKIIRVEEVINLPGIQRDSEGWRIFCKVKKQDWVREKIFNNASAAITREEIEKNPKSHKKYLKRQKYWTFLRECYEIQATMDDDDSL